MIGQKSTLASAWNSTRSCKSTELRACWRESTGTCWWLPRTGLTRLFRLISPTSPRTGRKWWRSAAGWRGIVLRPFSRNISSSRFVPEVFLKPRIIMSFSIRSAERKASHKLSFTIVMTRQCMLRPRLTESPWSSRPSSKTPAISSWVKSSWESSGRAGKPRQQPRQYCSAISNNFLTEGIT